MSKRERVVREKSNVTNPSDATDRIIAYLEKHDLTLISHPVVNVQSRLFDSTYDVEVTMIVKQRSDV